MRWGDFGSSEAIARTKRAVLSDRDAKKAYRNLQAHGLKSIELFAELVGMFVALHPEPEPAEWWKTPKTLAGLPRDVRAMAGRIERTNAHPLFFLGKQFMELPAILRQFAEQVDGRLRLLQESRKRRTQEKTLVFDELRRLVRKETGRERHADLAKILAAATGVPDFDFEAMLKMRAYRAPLK